jgi:hypothetical protein
MSLTKKLIELLTLSMLTIGCATIKHESFRTVDKLEKTDFNKLNGRYSNNPSDGNGNILRSQYNGEYQLKSFWTSLDQYQIGSASDWSNQTVEIEFVTAEKAIFRLYQGDSLIDKRRVRGKFKDGYFYARPFFVVMPLVPVLFGHNTHRMRIGKADDNLVVDYKWNIWMFFLIAGQSEKGQSSLIFSKR